MKLTFGLDGGGAVAADSTGKVYVASHGKRLGILMAKAGEAFGLPARYPSAIPAAAHFLNPSSIPASSQARDCRA